MDISWLKANPVKKFCQWRLDALSIPHFVIKKGRPHGARHGKTDAQKEHFVAHNTQKRCIKKNYDGIRDRFQRDPVYLDSQLKIGWTEGIEMDKLAQDFLGASWTFVTLDPGGVLWDTGAQEGPVGKQQLDKWCKLLAEHGLQVEWSQNPQAALEA